MQHSFLVRRSGLAIALSCFAACASAPRGATETNFARAKNAAPDGAAQFSRQCASCHGERGESVSAAPYVLGPDALPEYPRERNITTDPAAGDPAALRLEARSRPLGAPWRDPFRTAQDLFNYVSKHMPLPEKRAGSLSPEAYWSIVNFMLVAHGVAVPAEGVSPANAASVKLEAPTP
ncbi:MAG TPA: c-type cytochrome [Polyangiaceae bacterium]